MASLAEIIAGVGEATVFQRLKTKLTGRGLPVLFWGGGDPLPTILEHGFSPLLSSLYGFAADIARGAFLRLAQGLAESDLATWNANPMDTFLGWLATEIFHLTIQPPSFALGTWQVNNAGGPTTLPASFAVRTASGLIYRLVGGPVVVPAGISYITIQAERTGAAYNVAGGEINRLVTSIVGISGSNQPQPPSTSWLVTYGGDRETPASVVIRCRANWARLSLLQTSPSDAYVALALDPNVTGTAAVRKVAPWSNYRDGVGYAANVVTLYLGGDAGPVTLAQAALVQNGLNPYIGLHDVLECKPCGSANYAPTLTCYVRQIGDKVVAAAAVAVEFEKLQTALRIGQTVPEFAIFRALAAVPQIYDTNGTLTDFVPAKNALVTLSTANLTFEVGT